MQKTLWLHAHDPADVRHAATLLREGRLVAFPTETVYGLGANALSAEAVASIFRAKGRPAWDPLIVHLAARHKIPSVAHAEGNLMRRVEALTEAFWPGPLTLLLPRTAAIPSLVTAGRPLVGCRVPAHPVAQALLHAAGVPVAAPSANRFGHVSPTTAQHVLQDLDGRIDAVLDAGPCPIGVESTVLNPHPTPMILYRSGEVTPEQIAAASGVQACYFAEPAIENEGGEPESLPSPGVGLRHYAPEAVVRLTPGTPEGLWADVQKHRDLPGRVGVLLPQGWPGCNSEVVLEPWGVWEDPSSLAAGLFAGLRALELEQVGVIYCPLPKPGGLRDALRDRLRKAAMPR